MYLAGLYDEERRFAISHDYYKQVVEARPDYVWAFMPLGKFAWMEGKYAEAARWFNKAAAEDPDEFGFSMMAALSLIRSGKGTEGNRLLTDVLRRYERTETAYEVIRFCSERSSDFYAVNAFEQGSGRNPQGTPLVLPRGDIRDGRQRDRLRISL